MKWIFTLFLVMGVGLAGVFLGNPEKNKKTTTQGIVIDFQESHYKLIPINEGKLEKNKKTAINKTLNKEGQEQLINGCIEYAHFFHDVFKFLFWLGFTGIAGSFGGLLAFHYKRYNNKKETEKIKASSKSDKLEQKETKWTFFLRALEWHDHLYQNIMIGIGGAWGITLLMMIAKKYTFEFNLSEILIIWLFSFIAGFLGEEIITLTSDIVLKGLGKKVNKVQREIINIENRVNNVKDDCQKLYTETNAVTAYCSAITSRISESPSEINKSIEELEEYKESKLPHELRRKIFLMIGCLYNKKHVFDKDKKFLYTSIDILKYYLKEKNHTQDELDSFYYNLGCYYTLLIKDENSVDKKNQALDYFRQALNIKKSFIGDLKQDHDVKKLRDNFNSEYLDLINES